MTVCVCGGGVGPCDCVCEGVGPCDCVCVCWGGTM